MSELEAEQEFFHKCTKCGTVFSENFEDLIFSGCPVCKNIITIQGNPGEKTPIICPNCSTKGEFTFPEETIGLKKAAGSFSIEINSLSKYFKEVRAVDNVSFSVKTGEIFGLLGPNGAGKTTTIKAILDLLHMNSGNIKRPIGIRYFFVKEQNEIKYWS